MFDVSQYTTTTRLRIEFCTRGKCCWYNQGASKMHVGHFDKTTHYHFADFTTISTKLAKLTARRSLRKFRSLTSTVCYKRCAFREAFLELIGGPFLQLTLARRIFWISWFRPGTTHVPLSSRVLINV